MFPYCYSLPISSEKYCNLFHMKLQFSLFLWKWKVQFLPNKLHYFALIFLLFFFSHIVTCSPGKELWVLITIILKNRYNRNSWSPCIVKIFFPRSLYLIFFKKDKQMDKNVEKPILYSNYNQLVFYYIQRIINEIRQSKWGLLKM